MDRRVHPLIGCKCVTLSKKCLYLSLCFALLYFILLYLTLLLLLLQVSFSLVYCRHCIVKIQMDTNKKKV